MASLELKEEVPTNVLPSEPLEERPPLEFPAVMIAPLPEAPANEVAED